MDAIGAGWHVLIAKDGKGVARPFHLYVPESARTGDPVPLLVHMHGGVSRPAFADRVSLYGRMWTPYADEHGFVLAFPMARQDCMWWTPAGVRHVRACVREVKRLVAIDDDRILATGFSDGASGCYHLAMAAPDPFAGFLPFNGHPAVPANASGEQLYLHNLAHLPLLVAATRDDALYPAAAVLEHLLPPLQRGALIRVISYEGGNHRPVYFEEQAQVFSKFVMNTKREKRDRISWWSASPTTGRAGPLEILAFGKTELAIAAGEDINIMSTPGRIRLGVNIDRAFAGPGVKVSVVTEKSNAARMGIRPGDVLHVMDGRPIVNLNDLRAALARKKHGDDMTVEVQMGEDAPRKLTTKIAPFQPSPYYRRGNPTGHVVAAFGSDAVQVTARGVTKLAVHLALAPAGAHPAMQVTVNGNTKEMAPVASEPRAILEAYARDADAGRVFTHRLDIAVR